MSRISTIISWVLYFVPVYLFVIDPLIRPFFSNSDSLTSASKNAFDWTDWDALDIDADASPALHLIDDSFISPEDGLPLNCAGNDVAGYRVHFLSRAPLILYIENFLSTDEANHLVNVR